jgi:predicted ArsR family transcriptional regulator
LPALSLHILRALRAEDRLTIAQLASVIGANRNTPKVRLRELVAEGRVRQNGKACATWYSLRVRRGDHVPGNDLSPYSTLRASLDGIKGSHLGIRRLASQ